MYFLLLCIMSLAQFYTLASNRFQHKGMKSLKIATLCNPWVLHPSHQYHLKQSNVTSDCSLSLQPWLGYLFQNHCHGTEKTEPWIRGGGGGLCSITGHMPSVLLSSHIVFKDVDLDVYPWKQVSLGSGVLTQVVEVLLEVKTETHHEKRWCNVLKVKAETAEG